MDDHELRPLCALIERAIRAKWALCTIAYLAALILTVTHLWPR